MTVSLNRLVDLLVSSNHCCVEKLIFDIVHLEDKLAHPEEQSFYFKKGIKSVWKRLEKLQDGYASIMDTINGHSLEELEDRACEIKSTWETMKACGIHSWLNAMAFYRQESLYYRYMDLIATKKKYGQLEPLAELSPEERKNILELPPFQEGS